MNNNLKLAIIDCIGLNYDGTTLQKKGIGGSESSIISVAKELAQIGFDVTIFNDCETDETSPGVYDGVTYYPIRTLGERNFNFDVVISQRTVIPFTPEHLYDQVRQPAPRDYDPRWFHQVQRANILKVIWMQDTFIWGDHLLESLVINKHIDEIFCLSDWHISYTTNSTHGPRRNFEVLKKHIFHTRNAINRWIDWVDVKAKDPNLFVYNASITKGMEPLVRDIWPQVRQRFPQAKLKIIGGYYRFRDEGTVTEAQAKVMALQELTKNDPSVEFTGIIPQPKIAEIMASATYNLFPGAYPETSGISSIESVNYNTPIIGVRFGAMEESATDQACYYIDYAIEPNGLFPWINKDTQVHKYVDLVTNVVSNPYLHQQKMYACNTIKDVSTWDTVALQWKQHFYTVFDMEMPAEEQQRVEWINYRVHNSFSRRIMNSEEVIVTNPPEKLTSLPTPDVKIAIVDIVGMTYDGDTLKRGGLGGSESAVILVSEQLAQQGFNVTVYNACDEEGSTPGIYNGVTYKPLGSIANDRVVYDVVISSRCVTPFVPEHYFNYPQTTNRKYAYQAFDFIRKNAKLKVFWMHDTFCWGDDILEDLAVQNAIDEIWTLSDFHAMYVMNCSHPRMRNYEVLRRKVWTTRNGIVKYFDSVDLSAKDPNMFIFNANMSKGLDPLLNLVWPRVQQRLPDARLTVIGGFYKLGAAFAHDNEETEFNKIAGAHFNNPTITFTGIVSQQEVADLSAKASFFIYPTALPETYSISTLEALYANTPLLTCRFGAMEETASTFSHYIDYALVPNGLFPDINPEDQANKFVDMVEKIYRQPRIPRAKELDVIKDIAGWDTVGLEWKQHIYSKLGYYMSREENQQARYTKSKYHKIFGRRYSTPEEWLAPKQATEQKIVVVSPFYNAMDYIKKCIFSVASQDYDNYEHWLIDDASTDSSHTIAEETIKRLPANIRSKFKLIRNLSNQGAVSNHMMTIKGLAPTDVVMLLDGDDSLVNRPDIFDYYNKIHQDHDFTYGSCWSMVDNIPLVSQPYPPEVRAVKAYKDYRFNWNMPYTHLRTLKAGLLKDESYSRFQDADGRWFKAGGDNATFYAALENCDPDRVYVVPDIVYNYNDASPLNDYKVNKDEQDRAINTIVGNIVPPVAVPQPQVAKMKKRILIAIPTNRNIEAETFKSIYDLVTPEGYDVHFQYFWGYQVDQVRNLIADWTIRNGFDYLFSVDSDIAFAPDTLAKLLSHDKDIVSGVYIQRIPGRHTIEIMRKNQFGGVTHVDFADIKDQGLVPIDGCGFGCVLIKSEVLKGIPYPHFLYHSAIDHANTVSEDVHFCNQARDRGFTLWCDTSILCDHIGSWTFKVDNAIQAKQPEPAQHVDSEAEANLRNLSQQDLLPGKHVEYLYRMRDEMNIHPKVVYDIGACVLHWYNHATRVWPDADIVLFEAMDDSETLFKETGRKYNIGLLSDTDNKELSFYENTTHPGGNSYYRENEEFSPAAAQLFDEAHRKVKRATSLDTIVKQRGFPKPDLIKMDIQGAEMDVLKGAQETLKSCNHLILELQHVRYNVGAPFCEEVIAYLDTIGFKVVTPLFASAVGVDGDYHFVRYKYV